MEDQLEKLKIELAQENEHYYQLALAASSKVNSIDNLRAKIALIDDEWKDNKCSCTTYFLFDLVDHIKKDKKHLNKRCKKIFIGSKRV